MGIRKELQWKEGPAGMIQTYVYNTEIVQSRTRCIQHIPLWFNEE